MGLSLSYALSLTSTQIFLTRWYCYLSNYIISVERIKQFMHIPPEPPEIVEDNRPPSSWPSKGRIELQALTVRKISLHCYSQSPQALDYEFNSNFSFSGLFSDKISSKCSASSQGNHMHIQGREQSRGRGKNRKWKNNAYKCSVSFSRACKWENSCRWSRYMLHRFEGFKDETQHHPSRANSFQG